VRKEASVRSTTVLWVAATLGWGIASCDGGDDGGDAGGSHIAGETASLWVRYAVEVEVDRGTTAFATFYDRVEQGGGLDLEQGATVTCNGKRLEPVIDAWSLLHYYKTAVPELGQGQSYSFKLVRANGESYDDSIALPSPVTIDAAASASEVQPGREVGVTVDAGAADELEVSVVASCLAPAKVTVAGDATEASIPGDQIRCACEAGGLVPPCDGVIRAQRVQRGAINAVFAGGEALGVHRHEVDVSVIPE
jgi:hypothetical protein